MLPAATMPPHAPEPTAPRAALHSMGCRLNHAETAVLQTSLEQAGYRIVSWGEPAELLVINSCTVTGASDAKGRQVLRAMRRRFPGAKLALLGCYAQVDGAALAAEGLADLVIGNGGKMQLVEHLARLDTAREPLYVNTPISRAPFALETFAAPGAATRAHLKVQDGCDFMCSFCIIPVARGRARPRRLENLLAEARALAGAGVRELVLTGVNIGTWALEGLGLPQMVDALACIDGVERIRISSIEPTTVDEALLSRMADPGHALVPFLHLPLQSGSPAVLAAMRRRHGAADYRAFAERALAQVPGLCLGTDVMVGFPGEGDEEFADTVALLAALPFAYLHVFPYSRRNGTRALRLPEHVAPAVSRRRAATLRALSESKRLAFQRRHLGRSLPVLFEGGGAPGEAAGYTENYIRVRVTHPRPATLRNRILPVRLIEAGAGGVAGELAAEPLARS
ncbi:MAG: MiaB/RimO family radical SAM methylthiotransferase [Candidatus Lambdaproteobacteria bacterium]|nr:MiaB/RimO family radical SAM methylthiotransferase [Candidatus Lambdaproteobacteria bacterium]